MAATATRALGDPAIDRRHLGPVVSVPVLDGGADGPDVVGGDHGNITEVRLETAARWDESPRGAVPMQGKHSCGLAAPTAHTSSPRVAVTASRESSASCCSWSTWTSGALTTRHAVPSQCSVKVCPGALPPHSCCDFQRTTAGRGAHQPGAAGGPWSSSTVKPSRPCVQAFGRPPKADIAQPLGISYFAWRGPFDANLKEAETRLQEGDLSGALAALRAVDLWILSNAPDEARDRFKRSRPKFAAYWMHPKRRWPKN